MYTHFSISSLILLPNLLTFIYAFIILFHVIYLLNMMEEMLETVGTCMTC